MESYSLSERPALARRPGPYKEMLFSPSQRRWDGALCPQDRAALVGVGRGATRPRLGVGALNGPLLQAQRSLSAPAGLQPPPAPCPPTPRCPGLIGGKETKQNKTKTWPDFSPRCCLIPNYPENRLKSDSLSCPRREHEGRDGSVPSVPALCPVSSL